MVCILFGAGSQITSDPNRQPKPRILLINPNKSQSIIQGDNPKLIREMSPFVALLPTPPHDDYSLSHWTKAQLNGACTKVNAMTP